jgi:exopolyphosphatase / guanosine-5'-triphosphate,3'-diphosphate pyrophosphatase
MSGTSYVKRSAPPTLSKHYAIISVGTNSTRALLADMAPEQPRVDLARSIGTRVGEGVRERGKLGEEPMRRTLDAVGSHMRALRGHYVRLFAIATSALRRAENGDTFTRRMEGLLGVPVQILSGDEEAEASYRGAITAWGPLHGEELGVVDLGGGSTEYAVGDTTLPAKTVSCEIGAVRLTEALPLLAGGDGVVDLDTIDDARKRARNALAPIADFPKVVHLAFVGGTATTTAALIRGKRTLFETYELSRSDLQRALVRLCGLPLEERKKLDGMKPQRADILPAGIIILETVLDLVGHDRATATMADLLLGYLLEQRDRERAGRPGYDPGWFRHGRQGDSPAH